HTSVGNSSQDQTQGAAHKNTSVVWENDSLGNVDIFFPRPTDGGQNFSSLVNLSNSKGTSRTAEIATDGTGNISVLWADNTPPSTSTDIYFARSTDGVTFSAPKNISNNAGVS